jgi:uncharacterized protein (TIGR02145 family)
MMFIALAMAFIFSCSQDNSNDDGGIEHYGMKKEQFYDERDGKKYAYVTIGAQVWMAENLNYETEDSRCYGDVTGGDSLNNCATYGRLYKWTEAMEVCPEGWHLPSGDEWDALMSYVRTDNGITYDPNNTPPIGKYLKAKIGWASWTRLAEPDIYYDGNGEDKYGFAAIPGGYTDINNLGRDRFNNITSASYWWSTKNDLDRWVVTKTDGAGWNTSSQRGINRYSVRCVQD